MSNKNFLPPIIFIICATTLFLYWQLIYIPVQAEITKFDAETKKFQAAEKELNYLQTRYKNFEEIAELTAEKLSAAQELFPAEMNDEKFIAALYNLAADKNILINSVQVGEISENDSVQKQSIKIRLDADYISLLNFIREILDGERLANLESYSISSDGESNILNCELEFIIFAANLVGSW